MSEHHSRFLLDDSDALIESGWTKTVSRPAADSRPIGMAAAPQASAASEPVSTTAADSGNEKQ